MKTMIFAAGLGTRLAPLTDTCPKALIEVGGEPMLQRVIDAAIAAGSSEIIINVHHHAEMIKAWIKSRKFDVNIKISDESSRLLDTGGGVVKASDLLVGAEEIMLYNADIFTDLSLREMLAAHRSSGADVTLLTSTERVSSRRLLFESSSGLMRGWRNMVTGETRSPFPTSLTDICTPEAFGGIHVISTEVINMMKEWSMNFPCSDGPGTTLEAKFSITEFYTACCDRLRIHSFHPSIDYTWIDIGRPETLAQARELSSSHGR